MNAPQAVAASQQQADQADRDRVYRQTGTTMFVEAGAGTGKTTALVNRMLELVTGPGAAAIGSIAAITFTDKAAAELRNRVRARLNERLASASNEHDKAKLTGVLDGLDSAAISTLHGFARRILAEHPIEAGLPPRFEALDQISSDVEFDERWHRFIDELLSDVDIAWAVGLVDAAGVGPGSLRDIGAAFNANWDRVCAADAAPRAVPVDANGIIGQGMALLKWRHPARDFSAKAAELLGKLDDYLARLRAATTDVERFAVLNESNLDGRGVPKGGGVFRGADWAPMREGLVELRERCAATATDVIDNAIAAMCDRIARFTLEAAGQRRAAGRLEFHDLLVRARDLLRTSPEARASLHRRYRHLMLDEFQDTDPIQIEIAALIAADEHGGPTDPASTVERHQVGDETIDDDAVSDRSGNHAYEPPRAGWNQLDTEPGQLFFVGDPKQSIYRFRRADIELYRDAQHRFGAEIGESASLRVNFRSTASIMTWVNAVFGSLMVDDDDGHHDEGGGDADRAGDDGNSVRAARRLQAPYAALTPSRADIGTGPAVTVLGRDAHDKKESGLNAEGIRTVEAADVADVICEIIHDGWDVHDRHLNRTRPARLGDIAILVPTRTCLPQLEAGLSAASVPYRLEASEFVWRSRTVRDLMMCLRAAADPDDALAVVSALRTPMYGCGDDDLYAYYRAIGSWSYFAPEATSSLHGEHHRVASALIHLRALYDEHSLTAPSVLLERLVRERRVFEQAAAGPRTRDVWRHVRYVIDQARAWSESQHGGLRKFLRWVEMQGAESAKVTEAILPESDDDSVRVMTVHASKGLQFPVVIVAGLQGNGASPAATRAVFVDERSGKVSTSRYGGAAAVRLRKGAETVTFAAWAEAERWAEHCERIRLLYVACTRACDRLVVSLHREAPPQEGEPFNRSHAQVIADAMATVDGVGGDAAAAEQWDLRDGRGRDAVPPALRTHSAQPRYVEHLGRTEWLDRRDRAAASSQRRPTLSATGVAHVATGAAAIDDPESQAGVTSARDARGLQALAAVEPILEPPRAPNKGTPDDHLGGGRAPVRRGRGATATGKAVHGVLQSIDLGSGNGLGPLAAAQAVAEGIAGRQDVIEAFVRSALASDEVRDAARTRHWKEVYVAAPLDDAAMGWVGGSDGGGGEVYVAAPLSDADAAAPPTVVEGFVDLMYEDRATGGLVVVDYKTDALGAMPDADSERAQQYRQQCAAYAWCLARAAGKPVSRVVLLYLRQDGSPATADSLAGDALRAAVDAVGGIAAERSDVTRT
ncbi:UvrD-helicase domain-containing protein [Candidatus Poriferisodalis sp.]|uniref:UvrD-helicase domain-containing protein n=1 Tax=Candidatus Poriferisodalis sp. TaxID=3101277 RepID=UPI003B021EE9